MAFNENTKVTNLQSRVCILVYRFVHIFQCRNKSLDAHPPKDPLDIARTMAQNGYYTTKPFRDNIQ